MYKIKKYGNIFIIIEIKTGSILKRADTYDEIKIFYSKLKNGCGFIGYTPNFILDENDRNVFLHIDKRLD